MFAFFLATLLTAPFWFTVCDRVLRTIEIIHDTIHLGKKAPGLWLVSIGVWGHRRRVSDVSDLTCIQRGRGSCREELLPLLLKGNGKGKIS